MKKTKTLKPVLRTDEGALVVAGAEGDLWARVRRYVEGSRLFLRASLAAQIMAGMELVELHKQFPRGGDRRSSSHDEKLKNETWEEAVSRHLGVSFHTAYRWMEMARAARKRLAREDVALGEILEKHPAMLTPTEQELLAKVVHKISDGQTQGEFLLECGVVKAPQGSRTRGGDTSAHRVERTAEEVLEEMQAGAEQLCDVLEEALKEAPWRGCDDATKRRLAGLVVDLGVSIKEVTK